MIFPNETAVLRGVRAAIGFSTIYSGDLTSWLEKLFEALNDGLTIEDAVAHADNTYMGSEPINSVRYGDPNLRLTS